MNTLNHQPESVSLPQFIAVTGQEGSGKDSLGAYLAKLGYMHVSAGDVLRSRAREQGYEDPIPRSVLSEIGDEMKKEFGPSPITESTLAKYNQSPEEFPAGLVISGLRRAGELTAFKSHGATTIWIEADVDRRFVNQTQRARGDEQSLEAFMNKGKEEYYGNTQGGEEGVNLQAIEALADCRVVNSGSLDDLYNNAIEALIKSAS